MNMYGRMMAGLGEERRTKNRIAPPVTTVPRAEEQRGGRHPGDPGTES